MLLPLKGTNELDWPTVPWPPPKIEPAGVDGCAIMRCRLKISAGSGLDLGRKGLARSQKNSEGAGVLQISRKQHRSEAVGRSWMVNDVVEGLSGCSECLGMKDAKGCRKSTTLVTARTER